MIIVLLGIVHHTDHVVRADHSGWPFRPEVTIFTFTLLIYPLLALAYAMGSRPWIRAGVISTVAVFTLVAHTLIEPPQQIYGMYADNRSTDAVLYTVDDAHMHNLLDRELPFPGAVALLSIVLTALLLIASFVTIRDARRATRTWLPK